MRHWTWGTVISLLHHMTIYPYRVRPNQSPPCEGIHMRWSKQILRKVPSRPHNNDSNVQLLIITTLFLPKSHSPFAFACIRVSVRVGTASSSLSSCWCWCLSIHQGDEPLRENSMRTGLVALFKADISPLSWSKFIFRKLSYNLAVYECSQFIKGREASREMNGTILLTKLRAH